jgi:hypothetical protein
MVSEPEAAPVALVADAFSFVVFVLSLQWIRTHERFMHRA